MDMYVEMGQLGIHVWVRILRKYGEVQVRQYVGDVQVLQFDVQVVQVFVLGYVVLGQVVTQLPL